MATSVTPLRRPILAGDEALQRLRESVSAIAQREGHTGTLSPDLCFYRFSQPTTFHKSATFGVTLGVVLQGSKRLRLEGEELSVDARHWLVITRETAHDSRAEEATPERPYLACSILFSPERVARALLELTEAGAKASEETLPAFVLPFDAQLGGALERLLQTLNDPLERKLLAPLVIDEILYRLLRSDAAAAVRSGVSQAADAERILESMRVIRADHALDLSVEQIARKVAMSPSHFAHRFRAVARVSPMRYLREVRLDRARELLLRKGARAGEVASEVGFESAAHFAREFKRRFGVSPSHYSRAPSGT